MPELPEVETTCRGIAKAVTGKKVVQAVQKRRDLRLPFPKNFVRRMTGRKIMAVKRRAKYILIELDQHESMLIHLGMSGRMIFEKSAAAINKHDHMVLYFGQNKKDCLKLNDPRRFGVCDLVANDKIGTHKLLKYLGVEPLEDQLTVDYLKERFKNKRTTIKAALLDQRIIAGLGNIYVCEALFHASLSPRRRADKCTKQELAKLVAAIRKVLQAAIKAGGSSLRDYVQTDGNLGFFQNHFAVYDREGRLCPRCRSKGVKTPCIQRIPQGGRSSFYCTNTQK